MYYTADVECDDEEFHCRNRRECVSYDRVCDGLGDCGDRSDERGDECDINIREFHRDEEGLVWS